MIVITGETLLNTLKPYNFPKINQKNPTQEFQKGIFLAISRISAGVHERLSFIFVFCVFTFKIKTLPTATKIPKSRKVNIFV
jgi:hypothetical protein